MLTYNTSLLNLQTDPVIQLLRKTCLASPQVPINAHLDLQFDISAISWLGIKPTFGFDKTQACPSSADLQALTGLIRS